jgi:ferritin-like protein
MASTQLHERPEDLPKDVRDMHRALLSLMEELEAVDWYTQRIAASDDEELRRVLAHNRDEEKEHACMTLEWIRRRDPVFDAQLRKFLFRSDPIVGEHGPEEPDGDGSLGIGSLRDREEVRV